jgi:pimeloyl-ACP methyl ester carboxylesterase
MASLGERNVRAGDGRIVRTAAFGSRRGFPVVWHHGNPGSRVAPVSEILLRDTGIMLITYDRPGGGGSDPLPGRRIVSSGPDVLAIADTWRLEQFGTAGFSGGGSFALATAALFGDRVLAAVVLSGAAPIDADGLDFTAGMTDTAPFVGDDDLQQRRGELLTELEPTRQAILSDPYQALLSFVAEWPEADREALRISEIAVPIAEGMAECVRVSAEGWLDDSAAFHRPWGFDVGHISVPVAIWHGRDDVAAPITHGRWLAERIPRCTFNELEGGHYAAYLAIPDAFRWLASHV